MGDILFLSQRIPWPPDRGDKIRSHRILKRLATIAPVHVGTFADDEEDEKYIEAMAQVTASHCVVRRDKPMWRAGMAALGRGEPISLAAFRDARLQAYVNRVIASGRIDRIVVFSGQMAQYLPKHFGGRIVVDFCDVDSAKFQSYAASGNPLMRIVNAREAKLLGRFEKDVARRADASLFVTPSEAALFEARSGFSAAPILPMGNGIDHVFFDPEADFARADLPVGGPLIVFTGQMDYRPNVEAAVDFARNVLPTIRERRPDARFAIVGRAPVPPVTALAKLPGVIVSGGVPDVRSYIAAADLIVAPLRIARGIQNKVLEAMAMARPVLASACAAEGIEAQDGVHLRIAERPEDEARIAFDLLGDPVGAASLGRAARAHVIDRYGWDSALDPLERLLNDDAQSEAAE